MLTVTLEITEWNQVLSMIGAQPWNIANPLLMKMGEQLRQQQQLAANPELLNPLHPNPQQGSATKMFEQVERIKKNSSGDTTTQ